MKNRLIRPKNSRTGSAEKPLSVKAFTIGYIVVAVMFLSGVPTPYVGTRFQIPDGYLPHTIGAVVGLYVLILGLMKIVDRMRP